MTEKIERAIRETVEKNIVKIYESKRKLFAYNFLIGVARGLGTAFGATIVFALAIVLLSKLELVPFFGNFISQILDYLEVPLEN